jgi:hypothetical protein
MSSSSKVKKTKLSSNVIKTSTETNRTLKLICCVFHVVTNLFQWIFTSTYQESIFKGSNTFLEFLGKFVDMRFDLWVKFLVSEKAKSMNVG